MGSRRVWEAGGVAAGRGGFDGWWWWSEGLKIAGGGVNDGVREVSKQMEEKLALDSDSSPQVYCKKWQGKDSMGAALMTTRGSIHNDDAGAFICPFIS